MFIVNGSLTSTIFIREMLKNGKKNNILKYNSDECQVLCSLLLHFFFVYIYSYSRIFLFCFVLLEYLNDKYCNCGALFYFYFYVC